MRRLGAIGVLRICMFGSCWNWKKGELISGRIRSTCIGRKSGNVIMRESGVQAEGIIVDLHVVRVAPRLGIATGSDLRKSKTNDGRDCSQGLGRSRHGDLFLGREICRPKNPKHAECVMKNVCAYYKSLDN